MPASRDVLSIHGLELECIVGLHPHERDLAQPLRIDVDLGIDTESAAESERIGLTIDYDAMAAQIAFLLQAARFELLETAAHVLALHLLSPPAPGERRTQVEWVRLRLTKPAALSGRGVPSLAIEREAAWAERASTPTPFGSIDLIHQSRRTRIYRLNLEPGRSLTRRSHAGAAEAELVLGEGIQRDGAPVARGSQVRELEAGARCYVNASSSTESLLCVDRELVDEASRGPYPSPELDRVPG